MLAFKFGDDPVDRALHTKWLATADAFGRLFLLDDATHCSGGAEINLWLQADHLLRTGCFAQPALHAGILSKAKHWPIGVIGERSGRARRHTRQTEGATLDIDLD